MTELSRIKDFEQAANNKSSRLALDSRRSLIRNGAIALALLAGTTLSGIYGYHYLTTGRYIESTDDAYVKPDSTVIAPKVAGYIADVLVRDISM